MARVFECDKCGKIYKDNNILIKRNRFINADAPIGCLKIQSNEDSTLQFKELCDDCWKDLLTFLNIPYKEKENNHD